MSAAIWSAEHPLAQAAMRRANARPPAPADRLLPHLNSLLDLDQRSNDLIDTELTFCAGRAQGRPMKDYQKHLEKLRADAAECVLISDQATNPEKQELFDVRYRSILTSGDNLRIIGIHGAACDLLRARWRRR